MISSLYIHEYEDYDNLVGYVNNQFNDLHSLMEESNRLEKRLDFFGLVNEATDDDKQKKANVDKSFVDKIGETVIGIVQKVINAIKNVRDRISEFLWSKKTDMQKVEKLCKEYPDLKNEIIASFKSGDLDIRDIKSLNDLSNGTIDLCRKLNSGKIDESEFDKKFNSLYDKYQKYGKPALEMLGIVTTAVGAIVTLKQFQAKWLKASNDAAKESQEKLESEQKVWEELIKEGTSKSAISAKLRAFSKIQAERTRTASFFGNFAGKLANGIDGVIGKSDKLSKASAGGYNKIVNRTNQIHSQLEDRDKKDLEREEARAAAQTRGRLSATPERDDEKELDFERRRAKSQAEGRAEGTPKRDDAAELDWEYRKAKTQAEGKDAGTPKQSEADILRMERLKSEQRTVGQYNKMSPSKEREKAAAQERGRQDVKPKDNNKNGNNN